MIKSNSPIFHKDGNEYNKVKKMVFNRLFFLINLKARPIRKQRNKRITFKLTKTCGIKERSLTQTHLNK